MNKLFYVGIAFALLAGCSSTPINDANAPSDAKAGAASGSESGELSLDKLRFDSLLTQRSIYFDFDKFEVKPEYLDVVNAHARYAADQTGRHPARGNDQLSAREHEVGRFRHPHSHR